MLSANQLKLIHLARRASGQADAAYRTALRSIAGVETSKDLNQNSFEDMLAWFESQGWRDTQHGPTYWQELSANRNRFASTRQVWEIARIAERLAELGTQSQITDVPAYVKGLIGRHSCQRTIQPGKLAPWEANNVIEALKKILERLRTTGILPVSDPLCASAPSLFQDSCANGDAAQLSTAERSNPTVHPVRPTARRPADHEAVRPDEVPF